ncbi:hypothetical protein F5Y19DRAFT_462629 [Xylariaceae sp. FL1651]|nr:hypothetical protein F5Y19DRAFT_462629 [Xylariaceae sp. FL1651]
MQRTSDHWRSFDSLEPDSDQYKGIQLLLSKANFEYLKTRGIESRRTHQSDLHLHIEYSVDLMRFSSGFNHVDSDRTTLLSEIATMKIVHKYATIPIPPIFDFETSADQPFGYPYVFMECLQGRTVSLGVAESIPREHHAKVAKQLANIIPKAWHASPGPLGMSLEYFYDQRQEVNRQTIAMYPNDPDWLTACWVMKTALAHIIIEDRVRGPFPLCHLDLHYGNMLFDDDYNLTGIIDWSSAQAAPLEQLSVCPELATFPARTDEENRLIVELKQLVIESLKELERSQQKRPPLDNPKETVALNTQLTSLSTYMTLKSAEITYRQHMTSPRITLFACRHVMRLMYGNSIS